MKKENKDRMIHLRASSNEVEFYKKKAAELNMSLSVLIRISLLTYLRDK